MDNYKVSIVFSKAIPIPNDPYIAKFLKAAKEDWEATKAVAIKHDLAHLVIVYEPSENASYYAIDTSSVKLSARLCEEGLSKELDEAFAARTFAREEI